MKTANNEFMISNYIYLIPQSNMTGLVTLQQLIEEMKAIVGKWHPDPRNGGDGDAGNLLEDLLGVPENPLPVADYEFMR